MKNSFFVKSAGFDFGPRESETVVVSKKESDIIKVPIFEPISAQDLHARNEFWRQSAELQAQEEATRTGSEAPLTDEW